MKQKLYVVRKYIKATSLAAAIRKEPDADAIWPYESPRDKNLADAIGFGVDNPIEEGE